MTNMRVAVLVFPGVQMLDAIGPIDILNEGAIQAGRPGYYSFELIALHDTVVKASNGIQFLAHSTLETASDNIDTLLVAGGMHLHALKNDERVSDWLKMQSKIIRRLCSVCSGAFLLAQAGLLDGRRVTTHWNISAKLAKTFPRVQVDQDQIYIKDGAVYTSAGITAGMDLALALVEEDFGRAIALKVAREFVMFLKRPGGQSQFSAHLIAQQSERTVLTDVQEWALSNISESLSVNELAKRTGMSVRNFSRSFKREIGMTPADFVEQARIDTARRRLEETAEPLKRIATLVGLNDTNSFRRAFSRRLGISPSDYRQRFKH